MKTRFVSTLLAASITPVATSAQAWTAGDILLRAGGAGVSPSGDGGTDSAWSPGISLTDMATDNIGVGVPGAWPYTHDIKGKGVLAGAGKPGDTRQLPPTVTLQYHFDTGYRLHPCAGAGINYSNLFSTRGALTGAAPGVCDARGIAG
jgi:outer membrane protein